VPQFQANDMMLFAVGFSHKTAVVELREQLAVKHSELADRGSTLKLHDDLDKMALLSTCNHVETYGRRGSVNISNSI
jgi:glutamyl-tRNA reductase